MTPLDSIIYMIWRGIAVGVLISAPMGPVGILCIQRTLDKGRRAGFYTGIGAAISDLFYCLLTGFGLSFIEDFIESNQNVIQLVGSVVLIAFSVYLFRKDPSSPLRRPVPQNVSARKNILGGFLFTFSNPLIIFLIIGLFARFNFTSPDIRGPYYAIGYLFIAAGALGWWYCITYAIEKVRSRFNMRSMKIMNISIGVVILGFATVGIVSSIMGLATPHANAAPRTLRQYHRPADEALTDTLSSGECRGFTFPATEQLRFDFKLRHPDAAPGFLTRGERGERGEGEKRGLNGMPPWRITLSGEDGDTLLTLTMMIAEHSTTPLGSETVLICDASSAKGGICRNVTSRVDLTGGWNHYRLSADPGGGITLRVGDTRLCDVMTLPHCGGIAAVSVESVATRGRLELRDMRLEHLAESDRCSMDLYEIAQRLRLSSDPLECEWRVFDWSLNTGMAMKGGDYRLATVRRPDGCYEIVYLSGASILGDRWEEGMLKGVLHPTGISGTFRLSWRDAEGADMGDELSAQFIPSGSILILYFPFLESTIRLTAIK